MLRPAVAANVLVVDGDGYAFRHALIREAVHDDLLPGEHTPAAHAGSPRRWRPTPALVPGRAAPSRAGHHWYAAHDTHLGAGRRVAGGRGRRKALAYAERLTMLARVLELWDQVPDAAERIGADHVTVLENAASAADEAGEFDRGIKLVTAALRELEETAGDAGGPGTAGPDPARVAVMLELRGRMRYQMARPGFVEDLRAAVATLPADPPTPERARALATLGNYVRLSTDIDEARKAAAESLAVARALGDPVSEADALITGFCADVDYLDEDHLAEVEKTAEGTGNQRILLRFHVIKSHFLEGAGRHEEAAEVAERGIELAREFGVARTQGTFLCINQAEPLVSLGRWDEALRVLNHAREQDPPVTTRTSLHVLAGWIALARGDLATAKDRLEVSAEVLRLEMKWLKTQDYFTTLWLKANVELAEGRHEEALESLQPVLDHPGFPDDTRYALPALVTGASVCAESGDSAAEVLRRFEERAAGLQIVGPLQEAHKLTFDAELARARGVLDLAAWDAAAAAWESLGNPYHRARALYRAAEAALAGGDHDAAASRLRTAEELARGLGAAPLAERVAGLLRRTRTSPRGRRAGAARADAARVRGAAAGRRGPQQPRHRRGAVHLGEDRQRARVQHPREAGRDQPRRGRRDRPPPVPVRGRVRPQRCARRALSGAPVIRRRGSPLRRTPPPDRRTTRELRGRPSRRRARGGRRCLAARRGVPAPFRPLPSVAVGTRSVSARHADEGRRKKPTGTGRIP